MWGTIVWVVEYSRGVEVDYRVIHRSGSDKDLMRKGMLESAVRQGWKIVKIEEICNTFEKPKR